MPRLLVLMGLASLFIATGGSPYLPSRHYNPLCVKNNVTCAVDNTCLINYIPRNSDECSNMQFNNTITPLGQLTLGGIQFENYFYADKIYSQTAFNLTFYNITWTEMKFGIYLNGNKRKNTCRQFTRTLNSSMSDLSYDCLWSDESYEGKPFIMYYEAKNDNIVEVSRISFIVPFADKIQRDVSRQQYEVMTYVETMPSNLGRTTFNLMWQPAPDWMEVQCYRVYVLSNDSGSEQVLQKEDVCDCVGHSCTYTTNMWFGVVRFGVQPIFEDGVEGFVAKTQNFDLGGYSTRPLLIGLLTCSILLPVVIYLLLLLRNYLLRRATKGTPPVILFIYTPSTTPHLHMVEALTHYLNTNCNVVALMDELEIPNSPSKDPFMWCNESIQAADVVAVIASPFYKHLRSSDALYRTDKLLLRLMRERFADDSKTRFCVLLPHYTSATDIPAEASSLRRLNLPQDLNTLIRLACFRWPLPSFLLPSVSATVDLTERGAELMSSLTLAAQDLRANESRYIKEVEDIFDRMKSGDENYLADDPIEVEKFKTINAPIDMFAGKANRIALAHDVFVDDHEDLDKMNLLGEKSAPPIILSPISPFAMGTVDLDQLVL